MPYTLFMSSRGFVTALLAILLVGIASMAISACTSFAMFGNRTLYGMNFDYPPNEIRFSIEDHEAGAVFIGSFWMGEHYGRTVGMNEHGLFSSDQMVSPLRAAVDAPGDDEMYIWNSFFDGLRTCTSVVEVLNLIGDRRLVQYPSLGLHNLFADTSGDAMVVEAGTSENAITRIDGPFLVMTNFNNGDFHDTSIDAIVGDGADRYRTAYRMLDNHVEPLDINQAFDILESTCQPAGSYKTRYSLVADPEALEIYIALELDYDHIWKVSLRERTIETYRGFSTQHTLPLDEAGVTGPTLLALADQTKSANWLWLTLLAASLLVAGVVLTSMSKT